MSKNSRANKAAKAATSKTAAAPAADENVIAPIAPVETVETAPVADGEPTVEVADAGGKQKRVPMSRVFIGGAISKIDGTVASVKAYLKGFLSLGVGARKGYDNYWAKADGFTNPESIMKLTPDGISKMMAVLHHRAALYIAEGGVKGTEMEAALTALREYETVAVGEAKIVAKAAKDEATAQILADAKGCSLDDARKLLGSFVPTATPAAPAASVIATEKTLGETGTAIEDSSDTADAEDEVPVGAIDA